MTDAVGLTRADQDANLHPGHKDAAVKVNGSPRSVASPRKVSTKPKRTRRRRSWRMPHNGEIIRRSLISGGTKPPGWPLS